MRRVPRHTTLYTENRDQEAVTDAFASQRATLAKRYPSMFRRVEAIVALRWVVHPVTSELLPPVDPDEFARLWRAGLPPLRHPRRPQKRKFIAQALVNTQTPGWHSELSRVRKPSPE